MAGYGVIMTALGRTRRMWFGLDRGQALEEFAHWESCVRHRGQGVAELEGPDGATEIRSEWDGGECVRYYCRGRAST